MFARYWIAPVGLFVLQVAPVGVRLDSEGRYRVAVGGALGSYQETSTDCAGNVIDRQKFTFHTVGGEAEAYVAPRVRVEAHAGHMSTTAKPGTQLGPPFEGFFGGVMVAYEGGKAGVGGGLSVAPEPYSSPERTSRLIPMLYARLGHLDKTHAFFQTGEPAAPGGPPELLRVGLGRGWGQRRQVGARVTAGMADFPSDQALDLGLAVRFPIGRPLDLGFSGTVRRRSGGNFGVFGQLRWGPAPE